MQAQKQLSPKPIVVQVVLDKPLSQGFDYLWDAEKLGALPEIGHLVEVPFGRAISIGLVIKVSAHSDYEIDKLKQVRQLAPEMNVVMNVSGFSEALRSAILLKIAENFSIRVASLAGMAALKLIAWQDRGQENQGKDAVDFLLIAKSYHDAGNEDRIYTEELALLESLGHDPELAGIQLLGRDVAKICLDTTKQSIDAIFSDSTLRQRLTDQLTSKSLSIGDADSVMKVHAHLDLFYKGFSSK